MNIAATSQIQVAGSWPRHCYQAKGTMSDSVRVDLPAKASTTTPASERDLRILGWLSALGIGIAILIMIWASLVRQDWMYPPLTMPAIGPPWELQVHVSGTAVSAALWIAALLAAGGLVAGLVAARKGARGPIRLILIAASIAVVALVLLPPAGSTDALDYAAYGRLALLGHNPYVASPIYLRLTEPGFGLSIPIRWQHQVSLYGPAATIEQYFAAKLGGASVARVVFWLKLWNGIAFGLVAVVLDRVLRSSPAARLRAHLLWTINPLLLWDLIASGHLDLLAAAAGVLALLVVGQRPAEVRPVLWRAVAAGALVGLAADFKIDYLLFGIGLIWALRRWPVALLAGTAGAVAVLVPTYARLGKPAFLALFARRDKVSQDSFYRVVGLINQNYLVVIAVVLFIALAALLLWRMPAGDRLRPAIRPALALSVAWIFIWPYQLPWYDAMLICVLVLYPATRLDWLVLARLAAATIANMPGDPNGVPVHVLKALDRLLVHGIVPLVLVVCLVWLVILAITGSWGVRPAQSTQPTGSASRAPAVGS